MKLYAINAGYFKLDGGAMFGVVPKSIWNRANPADEANMCSWALRCLLVETGNHKVLIDCGMGDKQDAKFFGHYHLHGTDTIDGGLAEHGLKREDITDVFLTHLHFDHCGGAVKKNEGGELVPAFPNALYWTNRSHWDWATQPNAREKASFLSENILPLEEHGVLRFVEGEDGLDWMEDFKVRFVNGHTQAMMLPQLKIGSKTLLYCADLVPSVHHLPLPWVMAYDMQPLQTLEEKKRLLEEAAAGGWALFFEHDPTIECARITATEKGVRAGETLTLAQWEGEANKG